MWFLEEKECDFLFESANISLSKVQNWVLEVALLGFKSVIFYFKSVFFNSKNILSQ